MFLSLPTLIKQLKKESPASETADWVTKNHTQALAPLPTRMGSGGRTKHAGAECPRPASRPVPHTACHRMVRGPPQPVETLLQVLPGQWRPSRRPLASAAWPPGFSTWRANQGRSSLVYACDQSGSPGFLGAAMTKPRKAKGLRGHRCFQRVTYLGHRDVAGGAWTATRVFVKMTGSLLSLSFVTAAPRVCLEEQEAPL